MLSKVNECQLIACTLLLRVKTHLSHKIKANRIDNTNKMHVKEQQFCQFHALNITK